MLRKCGSRAFVLCVGLLVWHGPKALAQKIVRLPSDDGTSRFERVVTPGARTVADPGGREAAEPSLGVSVRVPAGKVLKPELERLITDLGGLKDTRLRIGAGEKSLLQEVISDPSLHVEFERPNASIPIDGMRPFNKDARISHRVPEFEVDFPDVRGGSAVVAIFDEGAVRRTHVEFQDPAGSRVSLKTGKDTATHSTHCAGTIGAKGVDPDATGMAVDVHIVSYDWDNDISNLNRDAEDFQISSHSYGPLSGWVPNYPKPSVWNWWGGLNDEEDSKYGKYTDTCSQLDEVLSLHSHVLTFVAAGNDRGASPRSQPITHFVVQAGVFDSRLRSKIGGESGLDSISGYGIAKNAICVGAVNDIPQGAGTAAIRITDFSGCGPADDGRIKPDLVANGFKLVSTSDANDDAYVDMSGTSMATPTAAGIASLLSELFRKKIGRNATSTELKAILIHSARDGGRTGPDPQYGWGSIDALAAGRIITGREGNVVTEAGGHKVDNGGTKTFAFEGGGGNVRVTVVWLDPPGPPNPGVAGIDDSTSVLQNDLDLRVISPSGAEFLPYSLDLGDLWDPGSNLPKPARTDRPNRVDNVEVVDAPSAAGTWKIEVHGTKVAAPGQAFALVVSGLTVGQ